jgi:hypothetical protein
MDFISSSSTLSVEVVFVVVVVDVSAAPFASSKRILEDE